VKSTVERCSIFVAVKERLSSLENPQLSNAAEQEVLAEKRFIALYTELTGASETHARNVYMYSDIIRQQIPHNYHLE
jgi:hypothetical protein